MRDYVGERADWLAELMRARRTRGEIDRRVAGGARPFLPAARHGQRAGQAGSADGRGRGVGGAARPGEVEGLAPAAGGTHRTQGAQYRSAVKGADRPRAAARGTAAATTSPPACSVTTTRATARFSATARCRRARSTRPASRRELPGTRDRARRGALTWPSTTVSPRASGAGDEEPLGTRSEIITGPVSDWATDFSHLEPEWAADPYPIQDDLRQRCPIAHTQRFGGAWLPTRYEDVAAIAYDTERFSSRAIILSNFRPPRDLAPIGGSPPISSDPPFHHDARKLLLPAFTKTAVGRQEAGHQGVLPLAHRRVRRAGRRRRRPRLRPAHPDAGHRRHARLPAGGRAAVP